MSDTVRLPETSLPASTPEVKLPETSVSDKPLVDADQLRELVAGRHVVTLAQSHHPDAMRAHFEFVRSFNQRSAAASEAGRISVIAAVDPLYTNEIRSYVQDRFADDPAGRDQALRDVGLYAPDGDNQTF